MELSSIINSVVNDVESNYGSYSILNLLILGSFIDIGCDFGYKVIPILCECENIIKYMLDERLTTSFIDVNVDCYFDGKAIPILGEHEYIID